MYRPPRDPALRRVPFYLELQLLTASHYPPLREIASVHTHTYTQSTVREIYRQLGHRMSGPSSIRFENERSDRKRREKLLVRGTSNRAKRPFSIPLHLDMDRVKVRDKFDLEPRHGTLRDACNSRFLPDVSCIPKLRVSNARILVEEIRLTTFLELRNLCLVFVMRHDVVRQRRGERGKSRRAAGRPLTTCLELVSSRWE